MKKELAILGVFGYNFAILNCKQGYTQKFLKGGFSIIL